MKSEYENVVEKVAKVARKSAEVDTQKRSLVSRLPSLASNNSQWCEAFVLAFGIL